MSTEQRPYTWSNSDAYEAFMGRWSRVAANAALDWLALPPGLRWLEVGCGTGALTEAILATSAPVELLAIDPSPGFLQRATERVHDERATFEHGCAEELPAATEGYDVVIAGLALHFMSDPWQGLREMTRAARPGGTVAGYIWDVASMDQFMSPFWRAATSLDPTASAWEPLYRQQLNSAERVTALFGKAPLDQVRAATVDFPIVFRDFADYWEPCLLDGSSPVQRYIRTLPEEDVAALRERLHGILPLAPDGSIPLRGRIWIARGSKST